MEAVYADPANYDWPGIRQAWDKNWAQTNPDAPIRMQKTPSDIFRIPMILPHFDPLRWIIMVRNPYNHVESIMRKATFQMDPMKQLDQICFHALRCIGIQIANAKLLGDSAYVMTYEDFVARTEHHRDQLGKFLPGLDAMNFDAELWLKGAKVDAIKDDSAEKMQNLIETVPNIIEQINEYFEPFEPLLNHWGYDLKHTETQRVDSRLVLTA